MICIFKCSGHHQKPFGVGEAFELDVQTAPHRAPCAVCADQVIGLQAVGFFHLREGHLHLISGLSDLGDFGIKKYLHMRHGIQLGLNHLRQFPLLALQPERMIGVGRDQLHVELGNHAFLPIALLGVAGHQTLCHQVVGQTQRGQHVQSGRVEGGGTQVPVQGWRGFKHSDFHALIGQQQGTDQADRSSACDHDMGLMCLHGMSLVMIHWPCYSSSCLAISGLICRWRISSTIGTVTPPQHQPSF